MLTHFMTLQAQISIVFIVCLFVDCSSFWGVRGGMSIFLCFYSVESGILMANTCSFLPDLQ